jgi:hypothetical protein
MQKGCGNEGLMTTNLSKRFLAIMITTMVGMVPMMACSTTTNTSSSSGGPTADAGPTTDSSTSGPFVPPADPGAGGVLVTFSAEDIAALGFGFDASSRAEGDPPAFVDGWEVKYSHVLVTVGKVRINEDPDKNDADPTQVGAEVAAADGPWAVDAVKGGSIQGKSGSPDEKAVALTAFTTTKSGAKFRADARYAFSYDLATATASAKPVNLDAEGLALYEEAKQKGFAVVLAGTATYKGAAPEATSVFAKIPKVVNFKLGFKNPTSYANCRNTDLQEAGGEYPRGIQVNAAKSITVQATLHTDHAFWNKLNVEGTPLSFDAIAAQASTYGTPDAPGVVAIEDLENVDITGVKTKAGEVLPARSLVPDYTAPVGQLRFDANSVSFAKVNSFAAFLAYSAASGGHMNANGECEVKRNYTP